MLLKPCSTSEFHGMILGWFVSDGVGPKWPRFLALQCEFVRFPGETRGSDCRWFPPAINYFRSSSSDTWADFPMCVTLR